MHEPEQTRPQSPNRWDLRDGGTVETGRTAGNARTHEQRESISQRSEGEPKGAKGHADRSKVEQCAKGKPAGVKMLPRGRGWGRTLSGSRHQPNRWKPRCKVQDVAPRTAMQKVQGQT